MKNFKKYFLLAAVGLLAVAVASSCKKDDDEDVVYPSLSGHLRFNYDAFIGKNTTQTLTPRGVVHPAGKGIGYHWRVSNMAKADTTKTPFSEGDGTFVHNFGDSLGTFTLTCTAFATGYTSAINSVYVTVVSADKDKPSVTEVPLDEYPVFTDTRDNEEYHYTTLAGLDWFCENLRYAKQESGTPTLGIGYRKFEIMSGIFGRYYSFKEISTENVCPEGWRVPSDEDWMSAAATIGKDLKKHEDWPEVSGGFMVYGKFNTENLWEFWPAVKVTNQSGMCVLPFGYGNILSGEFGGIGENATLWTSDSWTDESTGRQQGVYRYIVCDQPDMYVGHADTESFGASVRCVRASS